MANADEQKSVEAVENTDVTRTYANTASPQFSRDFYAAALGRGLLLRPLGNTVYFMPPYVIEEGHMEMVVRESCALLDTIQ